MIRSPRASQLQQQSGLGSGPLAAGLRRTATPATPTGGDGLLSVSLETPEAAAGSSTERYEAQWQQVEELQCTLVAISPAGGASAGSQSSGSSGGGGPGLRPLVGEVSLPPGASVLTFLAAPIKRGLYRAQHLRARLQQLPLHVAVQPPEPLWQVQGTAAPGKRGSGGGSQAASRRAGSRAATAAGGTPLTLPAGASEAPAGARAAEAILLCVDQAQPRVQLSLVAAGGSLIAGQEQWLGLAVAPDRDALHDGQLELTWPLSHAAGGLSLPLARKSGRMSTGSHHRVALSVGGDPRLASLGNSAAALSAASLAAPPFLRPEHSAAALLLPAAAGGGSGGQLLPADGPAAPAASWLLADGMQQQVALPHIEEGRPVSIWWRVTASECLLR